VVGCCWWWWCGGGGGGGGGGLGFGGGGDLGSGGLGFGAAAPSRRTSGAAAPLSKKMSANKNALSITRHTIGAEERGLCW
jgi:hypothetical protein